MGTVDLILSIAVLMCAAAAFCDLRWKKIPNVIPLFGALAGLGVNVHLGYVASGTDGALQTVISSLAGGLLAGAVPFVLHKKGAIGGGDVKLLAALGVIGRPLIGLELEFASLIIAAAVLVPVKLAWEGRLWATIGTAGRIMANAVRPQSKQKEVSKDRLTWFPLGPALLLGSLWVTYLRWGQTW